MEREIIASAFSTLEAGGCRPPANHQTTQGRDQAIDLWCELLEDSDHKYLRKAISTYLKEADSHYWPTPGQLIQLMGKLASTRENVPNANDQVAKESTPDANIANPVVAPTPAPAKPKPAAAPQAPSPPRPPKASRPPTSSRSLFGKGGPRKGPKSPFSLPPQPATFRSEPALPPSMNRQNPDPTFDPSDLPSLPESEPDFNPRIKSEDPLEFTFEPEVTFDPEPQTDSEAEQESQSEPEIDPSAIKTIGIEPEPVFQLSGLREYEESETESVPHHSELEHFSVEDAKTDEMSSSEALFPLENPQTLPTLAPHELDLDEAYADIPATDEIPSMVTLGEGSEHTENVSQLDTFGNREITEWDEDEFDRELSEMKRISEKHHKKQVQLALAGLGTIATVLLVVFFIFSGSSEEITPETPRKTARAVKAQAQANALELASSAPDLSKALENVDKTKIVQPENNKKTAPLPKGKAAPKPTTKPAAPKAAPKKSSTPAPKAAPKPSPKPEPVTVAPQPQPEIWATQPQPKVVSQPKPTVTSSASLVEQGWVQVEKDLSLAAKYFKQAIDIDSGNHDANLGYGYVLMKLEKLSDAQRYLCRARRSPILETQREATQFLLNNGLQCQ